MDGWWRKGYHKIQETSNFSCSWNVSFWRSKLNTPIHPNWLARGCSTIRNTGTSNFSESSARGMHSADPYGQLLSCEAPPGLLPIWPEGFGSWTWSSLNSAAASRCRRSSAANKAARNSRVVGRPLILNRSYSLSRRISAACATRYPWLWTRRIWCAWIRQYVVCEIRSLKLI